MNRRPTLSISVLHPLFRTAESFGIEKKILMDECGLNHDILSSPDHRITVDQYDCLIGKASELSGNHYFGLHLGKNFSIGTGNVAALIMQNCSNLLEAGEKYLKYQNVVDESMQIDLTIENQKAIISMQNLCDHIKHKRHMLDAIAVNAVNVLNQIAASEIVFDSIEFIHNNPDFYNEYKNVFPCRLEWGKPVTAIRLDKTYLETPVKQPNPELLHLLEEQADQILSKLNGEKYYTLKVLNILKDNNFDFLNGLEKVAASIPMSVRNLQHKLKEENTGYQKLLNNVRKEKAFMMLNKGLSITEISFLLGFSEPAVFQKAFRKWTGKSPGEYRNQTVK
ncbi:MAG: AraC family transcriptional regulator [Spirochaetia bacterium]|nr:AraC family transcriptional regulator [Spirochaetia bacterium]